MVQVPPASRDDADARPADRSRRTRAIDLAVRPEVLTGTATLAAVRSTLASEHTHLAVLVDDEGTLLTTVTETDLVGTEALPGEAPAIALGTVAGRTAAADLTEADVVAVLRRSGGRRLVVVDDVGHVLGLVCLKRSGRGFCTPADVAARRRDPRPASTRSATPRS